MSLSLGKRRAIARLADGAGRFKMIAIDQRPPLEALIRRRRNVGVAGHEDMAAIKATLAGALAPHASAMLIDPIYDFPRCAASLGPQQGLLVTLEHAVFEETAGGRRSRTIADWTVGKIKRLGGDGVKLLAWYRPDAAPEVARHQQDFVAAIGRACAAHDIPFLLELLIHPLQGEDAAAFEARRAEHVLASVKDFVDPRFAVDIFKLESPIGGAAIPDPQAGAEAAAAQAAFDALGRLLDRPWVMLSAGAGMAAFRRQLHYAYRAGASGYLAGRAIWASSAEHFPDLDRMTAALRSEAAAYLADINALTDAQARPWTAIATRNEDWDAGGRDFARLYADLPGAAAAEAAAAAPRRILFVDTGNYCRSPAAEGALRKLIAANGSAGIEAASAGFIEKHVGQPADPRTVEAAARRGIDLQAFRARQITPADFARHDMILAMDRENLDRLKGICPPGCEGRIGLFLGFAGEGDAADVVDPYYGGAEGFEAMMDAIERGVAGVLARLPRERSVY